jgi:hypothetical protein
MFKFLDFLVLRICLRFPTRKRKPTIHYKAWEGNSGAFDISANTHTYRPRIKHLNVKLNHFRDYFVYHEISVEKMIIKIRELIS